MSALDDIMAALSGPSKAAASAVVNAGVSAAGSYLDAYSKGGADTVLAPRTLAPKAGADWENYELPDPGVYPVGNPGQSPSASAAGKVAKLAPWVMPVLVAGGIGLAILVLRKK